MACATVVGGQQFTLNISDDDVTQASLALSQLEQQFAPDALRIISVGASGGMGNLSKTVNLGGPQVVNVQFARTGTWVSAGSDSQIFQVADAANISVGDHVSAPYGYLNLDATVIAVDGNKITIAGAPWDETGLTDTLTFSKTTTATFHNSNFMTDVADPTALVDGGIWSGMFAFGFPSDVVATTVADGTTIFASTGSTILADDSASATINVVGDGILVIGNDQGDAISITGNGTAFTADGGETIGSGTVVSGAGNDTITVKGNATITSGDGNDSVTVQLGNANITLGAGNDTISLGGPNDTVTTAGSATVSGPGGIHASVIGGQLLFQGGPGGESVQAGSGAATLLGGSGLTFIGGTGTTLMQGTVGGGGNDTYVGGSGNETMTAGHGAGNNVFAFDTGATPEGGAHVINNFVQGGNDQIQLGSSYNVANILNGTDPNNVVTTDGGGNAVLSLDSGATKITFVGINALHQNDFK